LAVAYSPDGKLLAASAMDGTVAVYDLGAGAGAPPRVMKGHHRPVRALAFTPGAQFVICCCFFGEACCRWWCLEAPCC
jgi:WD repeat-containing protein 61